MPTDKSAESDSPTGQPDLAAPRHPSEKRGAAVENRLQRLAELSLKLTGETRAIFEDVVRMIGELFAVRAVCLSQIVGAELRFRSLYLDGQVLSETGSCLLADTPCATVETTKEIQVYGRVAELFPRAQFLRQHQADAYCGFPSLDGAGRVVAVTCLLDDKPREFSEEDRHVLRIIGQRLAVEIERERHADERAQGEAALRANEAWLKQAQRIAKLGSWELDLRTNRLHWSDEVHALFEIGRGQFGASYEAFLAAVHPDDRAAVNTAYTRSIAAGSLYRITHRLLMPDGRIKWVEECCTTEYDQHGTPLVSRGTVQDITASEEQRLLLRASEEKFRQLASASPAGIFATDAGGRHQFVNAAWSRITGLDEDQARETGWNQALHPEDSPRVLAAWEEAVQGPGAFAMEYRFLNPRTGRTVWVLGQAEPVFNSDGRGVRGHVGTIMEVTGQKLIELALRALSTDFIHCNGREYLQAVARRLAEVLESEDAFIGLWSPQHPGRIRIAAHWYDNQLSPEQEHDLAQCACAEVLQKGQSIVADNIGALFPVGAWVSSSTPRGYGAVPITDSASQVIGLVGVAGNRSWGNVGRVESVLRIFAVALGAELERQRSHDRYQALFEFSPDAIVMTDRSGVIRLVNQQAVDLFGWSREEMLGQPVELLVPQENRATHIAEREHYAAHARLRRMGDAASHLRARRKDGSVFPADICLSPVETEEGMLVAAAVRDVTAQREAEEAGRLAEIEIRQAQKMESLGALAGGIAHDFNNILSGLLGFVELARMDVAEQDPARQWIERIGASGQRAKNLVRQILAFSRKDKRDEMNPIRLQSVVNEALDLLRSSTPAMVRIERSISDDAPSVMADPNQIHQVVMNLCTNAWRALPEEGGIIRVELDLVVLSPEDSAKFAPLPAGAALRLAVVDNGCGMTPGVLEHIFEQFYTTRPTGEGTGLGLSIVHGIVRGHAGVIRVSSAPGQGTRFDLYFPAFERASPSPGPESAPIAGNGERILLVDDDQQCGEALRQLLQRVGYQVTLCADSPGALSRIPAMPREFDLLITDFAMPGMSGLALLQALRMAHPHFPVVLMSGNFTPATLAVLAKDPHTLRQEKPVVLGEFSATISRALALRRG